MRQRIWLSVAAAVFVCVAVAWFWLLHTEPGAKWAWGVAQRYAPVELSAEAIDGDLSNGASILGMTLKMEGLSASIDRVEIAIDVDLLPLSLEVRTLHIRTLQLELSSGENAQETAAVDPLGLLESLALPVRVDITDLQFSDASLSGIVEDHAIEITELKLIASWKESLEIERFHAQVSESTIDATTALTFASPFNLDFSGHLQLSPTLTGLDQLVGAKITAGGNLKSLSLAVDTDGIEAELRGTISNMLNEPSWDLAIDIPRYEQAIDDKRSLLVENIELVSLGDVNEYEVQAGLDAHLSDIEPLSINFAGIGTLGSIAVSSLQVDGTSIGLSATGVARWAEPRRVGGDVEIARFSPSEWILDWPATEQVTGTVSLLLTESRLLIEESSLAIGYGDSNVQVAADMDLTSEIVVGEVAWNDIRWPLVGDEPQVASDNGTISLSGTLDEWAVTGRAEVGARDIAAGQFVVAGHGNREQLSLQIEEGDVLGGSLRGQVEYSWIDNQLIDGTLRLDQVSIGALVPDWPGTVSGGVVVGGQLLPLGLQIDLNNLDGTLRGKPLSADGALRFDNNEVLADALSVRHGESIISLDGSPLLPAGLAYELQIDNLGDYLDDYYGSFEARGSLMFADTESVLHIDASSEEIGFLDYRLQGLHIVDHRSEDNILDIGISADTLTLHGKNVTDVSMRSSASREQQELTFAATTQGVRINLGIIGAFEDWDHPGDAPWNGELSTLTLEIDDKGKISLVESAAIALSSQFANIDSFCVGHQTETHFCASGAWNVDGTTETQVELMDIPVSLINVFADTELEFDQLISGSLSWLQSASSGTSGNADIRLTPGTFREARESGVVVATGPGSLSFDIRGDTLLAGTVELPMPGTGDIRGDFSVLDVSQGLQSGLEGTLDVALNDLGIAAAFSQLVDDASGSFRAQMLLRGTAEAPILTGDFGVTGGKLTYLPIGLKLDDLQIAAELHGDRNIQLTGQFLAGDGRAEITTRGGYEETSAKGLELVLRGENLTVIDVPDLRAVADSDLRVSYDKNTLTLGGSIFVSHADIRPHNLTASRVSESNDVVIVAGILPDEGEIEQGESKLEILGELEIGLGDDVVIDLDVAKAKLTGAATFVWSGDLLPMANGRYDLTGDVQAFGQVLNISEGTVRFPNILADNPFIRIRAEREIYGNSQVKRAGILVAGTAKRQTIEPYTFPLTNEERALTLLVTGSEFDYEQGVGAVDFGTYIAPKLFVSYGIGLFDQDNVISARYDLVKGLGVKASSGEKSSGVDLIYRIER